MANRILRAVYNVVFQRRLYYHLRSEDKVTCNFNIKLGLFLGHEPKLSFKEICSGFKYALYVGESDPSAMGQIDKWFTCEFLKKEDVLILLYTRGMTARKKIIQFFMNKHYNFVSLPDFSHLALHPIHTVFYIFNSLTNPYLINMREAKHIHIGHGESDKSASVHMMNRIYDHLLVSGDLAIERVEKADIVSAHDIAQGKIIRIGMPYVRAGRATVKEPDASPSTATMPMSVLYAPTWDGATTRQQYASLQRDVGRHYLESLIAQGLTTSVAFRPHPSTGLKHPQYIERCLDLIESINKTRQIDMQVLGESHSYIFNTLSHRKYRERLGTCRLIEQPLDLTPYDLVVTDISSVITACIAYGVPYVVLHMQPPDDDQSTDDLYDTFPLCRGGVNYLEGKGYLENIGPGP